MPATIPDAKLIQLVDDLRQDNTQLMGVLRLYQNDPTISNTSIAGDFTEANFSGYTAWNFNQTGSTWPAASSPGSGQAHSVHADVDFTHDGGATANDIYGAYITDSAGALIAAKRYSLAPFNIATVGQKFTISPSALLSD